VFATTFLGRKTIIKERIPKRYRVRELDEKLTKQRLVQEARCMAKCRRVGVPTPTIFLIDKHKNHLYMERVEGQSVKDILRSTEVPEIRVNIAKLIGETVGKMHQADIVHGDLTTSNILVKNSDSSIVLIDFGLGTMKSTIEDKAVDLYVLERALFSTHPGSEHLVSRIIEAYRFSNAKSGPVLEKLEHVRLRGRKRDMFG